MSSTGSQSTRWIRSNKRQLAGLFTRCEGFSARPDEPFLLGGGHGEDVASAPGELAEGELVRVAEELLEFGGWENAVALNGDPEGACEVGGGEDAFSLKKLVVEIRAGRQREDAGA